MIIRPRIREVGTEHEVGHRVYHPLETEVSIDVLTLIE